MSIEYAYFFNKPFKDNFFLSLPLVIKIRFCTFRLIFTYKIAANFESIKYFYNCSNSTQNFQSNSKLN